MTTGATNNYPSAASPWTRRGFLLTAAALTVVPYVFAGCDAVAVLSATLDRMGVVS
ncbi:hypothetical protein ABZ281_25685 [Streptomyces sp. NPDC006265]|uniref:hypothetical protein n=1 Tax=Streptomyces sp. NPDC006265 TaxID=3156740 RepID=UPI0033AE1DDC